MRKAFGRGFDSRRLHYLWLLFFFCAGIVLAQDNFLTVFEGAKKTRVTVEERNGTPYFRLNELKSILKFEIAPIEGSQSSSMTLNGHNVLLSSNRTLVSVNQKLVSLNSPVVQEKGIWFVPFDFISKVLKPASTQNLLWLESTRSLIIGDVEPNQIMLKRSTDKDFSRLVFQSSRPVTYSIVPEEDGLLITPEGEEVVVEFPDTRIDDGIIETITVHSVGAKKAFRVKTPKPFGSYKSFELKDPPRLVVDVFKKQADIAVEKPQTQDVSPTLLPSVISEKRVIVLDPGHGGTETGAKGTGGTYEKDVVMGIARRLKSVIENNSATRVILTRESDKAVGLDERTAIANNNKAELFISIHANATMRGSAKGAETYFLSSQATDNDARNLAAVENNAIGLRSDAPEVNDELKLILWDMAQTEYLTTSSQLAEMIQQELNSTLGLENRGIKQAPFRVLMGATMPAVLIEVGFINNPEEEKLMKDSEHQLMIARAIFRSIQKFQSINSARAKDVESDIN